MAHHESAMRSVGESAPKTESGLGELEAGRAEVQDVTIATVDNATVENELGVEADPLKLLAGHPLEEMSDGMAEPLAFANEGSFVAWLRCSDAATGDGYVCMSATCNSSDRQMTTDSLSASQIGRWPHRQSDRFTRRIRTRGRTHTHGHTHTHTWTRWTRHCLVMSATGKILAVDDSVASLALMGPRVLGYIGKRDVADAAKSGVIQEADSAPTVGCRVEPLAERDVLAGIRTHVCSVWLLSSGEGSPVDIAMSQKDALRFQVLHCFCPCLVLGQPRRHCSRSTCLIPSGACFWALTLLSWLPLLASESMVCLVQGLAIQRGRKRSEEIYDT